MRGKQHHFMRDNLIVLLVFFCLIVVEYLQQRRTRLHCTPVHLGFNKLQYLISYHLSTEFRFDLTSFNAFSLPNVRLMEIDLILVMKDTSNKRINQRFEKNAYLLKEFIMKIFVSLQGNLKW